MRRLISLYRSPDGRQALWLAPVLASPVCLWIWQFTQDRPLWVTLAWWAVCLVAFYLASRLIVGKISSDLREIHERNVEAGEWARPAGEAFAAQPIDVAAGDEEFAEMVDTELDALPGWLRQAITDRNVAISIDEELEGQPRTLGLFHSESRGGDRMSEITLYRRPIMRASRDREGLRRQIHETLLHELGHLFGMSEADLDRYTIGNNPLPGAEPVHPPPELR